MKKGTLLNADLNAAIAAMGHGETMIVCDAGFPIPRGAWRIDLAIERDVPDLETVLSALASDFIAERVVVAQEVEEYNPSLLEKVRRLFPESEHGFMPHAELLSTAASSAKVVVRTGAFDPWGNVVLSSGVDVPRWFERPEVKVPDYYAKRAGRR